MTMAQALATAQRWRWIVWPVLFAFLAIGFEFKTPASQFGAIRETNAQQDSAIASLTVLARALAIGQCLDRPRRETQMMGLPCDVLLRQGATR